MDLTGIIYWLSEKSSHKCTAERQPPKPKRIADTLLWIRPNLLPLHNFFVCLVLEGIFFPFCERLLSTIVYPCTEESQPPKAWTFCQRFLVKPVPICSIDTISLFIWIWLEFSFFCVKVLVHSPHNLIPNVSRFQTSWFATCSSLTKVAHCIQHKSSLDDIFQKSWGPFKFQKKKSRSAGLE